MPDADLVLLMPVYNDWECVPPLLDDIDAALAGRAGTRVRVILADDGSDRRDLALPSKGNYRAIRSVEVLRLRRNLGHERAIAVGLAWIHQERPSDGVIIMDADGEDRPKDIPALIDRWEAERRVPVVFAARQRRAEGVTFRLFYRLFQLLHFLLVGAMVRVGHFSLVPRAQLSKLVVVSELWNHYAASVQKARLPRVLVPADRGRRIAGKSTMNFVSLVIHGLSAISVFADTVGVRILFASFCFGSLTVGFIAVVLVLRLATDLVIPGWATFSTGLLLLLLAQCAIASFMAVLFILTTRNNLSFLPLRDFRHFVESAEEIHSRP
ncbi:MAG TPA: glycosyltransferase [Planctomycetota bacterium]|nr:glycosyltransferase [Planctomycetota bacterium]